MTDTTTPTTIYGLDGRTIPLTYTPTPGACHEAWLCRRLAGLADLLGDQGVDTTPCAGPEILVRAQTGRPRQSGSPHDDRDAGIVGQCYCVAHGGVRRALAEIDRDWHVHAPLCVEDVLTAGNASLGSQGWCIVVRPSGHRWVAALGIGSHTRSLRGSWPTQEAAIAAATDRWQASVAATVEAIRLARGGTLAWGLPVTPRETPHVIVAAAQQSAYAADRVARVLAALPGAQTRIVPIAERWVNGRGTIPLAPADADERATVITAPGLATAIVVIHADVAYLAPPEHVTDVVRPACDHAVNVSAQPVETILELARTYVATVPVPAGPYTYHCPVYHTDSGYRLACTALHYETRGASLAAVQDRAAVDLTRIVGHIR